MGVYSFYSNIVDYELEFHFDETLVSLEEFASILDNRLDWEKFLHREDGPAWIGPIGDWWFYEGKRHRIDGPATDNSKSNGETLFYLNGVELTFKKWLELTPIPVEQKIELKLQYTQE